ncbi:peptidyl-prolyl cis-trans isomerase FKBP8-like isoform X2 [Euwallacea fornicatus]|uniref:peptidyl-prolyl cis-trans isomerase FKBP8-like isoform X2 n=1 Tax=Euwallacea fornicatus TaxID=995702 RepID=UPI00338DF69A
MSVTDQLNSGFQRTNTAVKMSALNSDNQLITEQLLENLKNDVEAKTDVFLSDQRLDKSEKLILDEISKNELPEELELKPENPELITNETKEKALEDTDSSRNLNSNEKDLVKSDEKSKEWQDILGSGIIMKKLLKEGEPDSRPLKSDKCIISYTCRVEDSDEKDFAMEEENFELALGEGDVIQGLDVAIGLMNKHERCLLKIGSRLAFGDKGLPPKISGGVSVIFDIELIDTTPEEDLASMSIQEKQRQGNLKRERGNWWYQRGEHTLAIQCYRRALDYLNEVESENAEKPSDSVLQHLLEDRLKVLNNMASAQIKMELFEQALVSLQTVLCCQPDNIKALFRKAKIHTAKNELPQALKLFEKARSLEPEDPLIVKEILLVSGLIHKQKNSEKEYARRMFANVTPSGALNSKTKVKKSEKRSGYGNKIWVSLGATVAIGVVGILAYKFKYF